MLVCSPISIVALMTVDAGGLLGGRYRLIEPVGHGGMGQVWRGHDEVLDRQVAVKQILLPAGVSEQQRDLLIRRVQREARAAARLNHPGIVTVHDVIEHQGAPTIVMEFLTGTSLGAEIERVGRLPVEQVAHIGAAMLDALREAHRAGIVHRDLKPDNVLLAGKRVVITDFGIASMADATTLTVSGMILGTPRYMAPEQIEGHPTPASDLWCLGATLYTAVEGKPPFDGQTLAALYAAILTQDPRPVEHAGPLAPVLQALLVKDPARRASAQEAYHALTQALAVLHQGANPVSMPAFQRPRSGYWDEPSLLEAIETLWSPEVAATLLALYRHAEAHPTFCKYSWGEARYPSVNAWFSLADGYPSVWSIFTGYRKPLEINFRAMRFDVGTPVDQLRRLAEALSVLPGWQRMPEVLEAAAYRKYPPIGPEVLALPNASEIIIQALDELLSSGGA